LIPDHPVSDTPRILVVDDELHIREVIQYALEREGFAVELAENGEQALERVHGGFDLVVLDILMPELDGLSFCRKVRTSSAIPIIFVSSRAEEIDRVIGLELGGDDYLVKPFSPRELVARIRTVLRRSAAPRASTASALEFGPLIVDTSRHQASVGGVPIALTATEFAILHALLSEAGRVLSRADLVARAYQAETHVTLRTMDTHVRRIRGKLRRLGVHAIETVHGIGYRAAAPP
jgi:two-component system, OmpR family, response regulator